jgi:phosphatidylinositol-4,5-bisphosphate 3-kinase
MRIVAHALFVRDFRSKFMSSKKVPLWLVFNNADPLGPDIYVIFKSGDDLRQDILTLQLLSFMDRIWLEAGLDCRLKPYRAVATGVNDANEGVGMIEVVMGSDTTSGIQLKYGGGAIGALKLDPLDLFLRAHNPAPGPAYDRAVDNFLRSCAGYCVATFVLGIGDRHNGNIMLTREGHLFRTCRAIAAAVTDRLARAGIPIAHSFRVVVFSFARAQTSTSAISSATSRRCSIEHP